MADMNNVHNLIKYKSLLKLKFSNLILYHICNTQTRIHSSMMCTTHFSGCLGIRKEDAHTCVYSPRVQPPTICPHTPPAQVHARIHSRPCRQNA